MRNLLLTAFAFLALLSCQESFDERCAREAKSYTKKNCPARIDEFTIMDSMTYDMESRTVGYFYTLTNRADSGEMVADDVLREAMRNQIRTNVSLKTYRDNDVTFRYAYRSQKTGEMRYDLIFTKEEYK